MKNANYPNVVEKVASFLNRARERYPDAELDRNGEITYANGNDGTDFDWEVNGRLCEFGWGVKDDYVWAFKCLVNQDGSAEIYCYPHGESQPVETIQEQLMTEDEAYELYNLMLTHTDYKGLWDPSLSDVFANCQYSKLKKEDKYAVVRTTSFATINNGECILFSSYEKACEYMHGDWKEYYETEIEEGSSLIEAECYCREDRARVTWEDGEYTEYRVIGDVTRGDEAAKENNN